MVTSGTLLQTSQVNMVTPGTPLQTSQVNMVTPGTSVQTSQVNMVTPKWMDRKVLNKVRCICSYKILGAFIYLISNQ